LFATTYTGDAGTLLADADCPEQHGIGSSPERPSCTRQNGARRMTLTFGITHGAYTSCDLLFPFKGSVVVFLSSRPEKLPGRRTGFVERFAPAVALRASRGKRRWRTRL